MALSCLPWGGGGLGLGTVSVHHPLQEPDVGLALLGSQGLISGVLETEM